jgi:hypothetical protein
MRPHARWTDVCIAGPIIMTRTSACLMALGFTLAAGRVAAQTPVTTTGAAGTSSTSALPTTNDFAITLNQAGGKNYIGVKTAPSIPINQQACDQGTIEVELLNLPPGFRFVQVWEAPAQNDCSQTSRATSLSTNGTSTACVQLKPDGTEDNAGAVLITLPADQPITVPIGDLCGTNGSMHFQGMVPIYFLLTTGTSVSEATTVFSVLNLPIATTPPEPATNVKGSSGETEIPVTWTRSPQTTQYFTVIDPTAISSNDLTVDAGVGDEPCYSSRLTAGMTLDLDDDNLQNLQPLIVENKHYSSDGTTLNGDSYRTRLAAIGVVTKDVAGNYSQLSNVSCVVVVPTNGFWQRYLANGGDAEQGCGCSTVGGSVRPRGALGFVPALTVLGLLAIRRRTRRRNS